MYVLNAASRRAARPARRRRDHSVIVIAFMMALVFVPVLGMHAVATTLNNDVALAAVADGFAQVAKRFERQPG